jgi:Tfp pilus assembly major pilin PilA
VAACGFVVVVVVVVVVVAAVLAATVLAATVLAAAAVVAAVGDLLAGGVTRRSRALASAQRLQCSARKERGNNSSHPGHGTSRCACKWNKDSRRRQ